MLIGLSMAAALLTATAVAMDASLRRVPGQPGAGFPPPAGPHRRAPPAVGDPPGDAHQPYGADAQSDFADGWDVDDTGIRLEAADGTETVFRYDAANERVLAEVGGATHVMIDGVEAFTVHLEPMKSPAHVKAGLDHDLLRRATVLLTVRVGDATPLPGEKVTDHTLTISSSAMPRRNAW